MSHYLGSLLRRAIDPITSVRPRSLASFEPVPLESPSPARQPSMLLAPPEPGLAMHLDVDGLSEDAPTPAVTSRLAIRRPASERPVAVANAADSPCDDAAEPAPRPPNAHARPHRAATSEAGPASPVEGAVPRPQGPEAAPAPAELASASTAPAPQRRVPTPPVPGEAMVDAPLSTPRSTLVAPEPHAPPIGTRATTITEVRVAPRVTHTSQPVVAEDTVARDAAPIVHVTIGRIDVRALHPNVDAPAAPAAAPPRRALSLDTYLTQRQRGLA